MPTFVARFRLTKTRSRREPRAHRKLTRTRSSRDTGAVERDPMLASARVVRKPRKSLKRRLVVMWKRFSTPSRPRASRRFSFMPPGFDRVSHDAQLKAKRDSRRWSRHLVVLRRRSAC
ncbi:hypothetical protein C8R46DRAFT_1069975 [Mycena filopes]|nr:hypothetical protein C8R46DRAFT_1069975 [Mycena filopes]